MFVTMWSSVSALGQVIVQETGGIYPYWEQGTLSQLYGRVPIVLRNAAPQLLRNESSSGIPLGIPLGIPHGLPFA